MSRMQPVDADRLHVGEVHHVVDVAHRVHVASADGQQDLVRKLLLLWNVDLHDSVFRLAACSGQAPRRDGR